MLTIDVLTTLHCSTSSEIEIPEIEDWSEIKEWYVKWDAFHYTLDGETWHEVCLDSEAFECIDWKRPIYTDIRDVDGKVLAKDE